MTDVDVVRAQLGAMQRDMGKLEAAVDRVETAVQGMQVQLAAAQVGRRRPGDFLRDVLLMVPLYGLVIDLLIRAH